MAPSVVTKGFQLGVLLYWGWFYAQLSPKYFSVDDTATKWYGFPFRFIDGALRCDSQPASGHRKESWRNRSITHYILVRSTPLLVFMENHFLVKSPTWPGYGCGRFRNLLARMRDNFSKSSLFDTGIVFAFFFNFKVVESVLNCAYRYIRELF